MNLKWHMRANLQKKHGWWEGVPVSDRHRMTKGCSIQLIGSKSIDFLLYSHLLSYKGPTAIYILNLWSISQVPMSQGSYPMSQGCSTYILMRFLKNEWSCKAYPWKVYVWYVWYVWYICAHLRTVCGHLGSMVQLVQKFFTNGSAGKYISCFLVKKTSLTFLNWLLLLKQIDICSRTYLDDHPDY